MTGRQRRPDVQYARIDTVDQYYAVSVSHHKSGRVSLRLTSFIRDPRHLVTTYLGDYEAPRDLTLGDVAGWLLAAANHAQDVLAPPAPPPIPEGQLELPL